MNAVINLLSAEQIEFIAGAYGSVEAWFAHYGQAASIAIEDMIL